jgi:hypothetical protein
VIRLPLILLSVVLSRFVYAQSSDTFVVNENLFDKPKDKGQIEARLNEASGIAASFKNPGCLWVVNDSGNPAEVFLIDSLAKTKLVCKLQGIKNRDWEDIAIGSGPKKGRKYIYVAEIGDNNARYDFKYLYRFEEPSFKNGAEQLIANVETLIVKMPDGSRDAETLMIDPLTNDLYIISKREEKVRIYFQKYPYPKDTLRPSKVLEFPFNWVTSGAISNDGKEVLIKNYTSIYYWKRTSEKLLLELLTKKPVEIPYKPEPQGEAICFTNDDSGFYTISETRDGKPLAQLKFYKRK